MLAKQNDLVLALNQSNIIPLNYQRGFHNASSELLRGMWRAAGAPRVAHTAEFVSLRGLCAQAWQKWVGETDRNNFGRRILCFCSRTVLASAGSAPAHPTHSEFSTL